LPALGRFQLQLECIKAGEHRAFGISACQLLTNTVPAQYVINNRLSMEPSIGIEQENCMAMQNDEHSHRSLEEAETPDARSPEGSASSADCTSVRGTQCLIPRKPVGIGSPVMRRQPDVKVRSSILGRGPSRKLAKTQRNLRGFTGKIRPFRSPILKYWWLEIGACFLFLIILVAIVATLYPHQGKPLPQWPYHLSVNTVISIYVVILKSTILLVAAEGLGQLKWKWLERSRPLQDLVQYDDATRGPLGAFSLLRRLRLRHPLSSIGALIVLLVLVIDPFTQQVIDYYDCGVPVGGVNGTVPRTNVYLQRDTNQSQATNGWIEPAMQAAIVAGVISPSRSVHADCPTGNCTFGDYSTVAYCSACQDVTKDLSIQTTFVESNYSDTQILSTLFPNGTVGNVSMVAPGFLSNTNISVLTSLPSGLSVFNGPGTALNLTKMQVFVQGEGSLDQSYRVEVIVGKQFKTFDPATGKPPSGCENASANDTWFCNGYGAASCTLSPCVRTYMSVVNAGVLQENRVLAVDGTGYIWGRTVMPSSPTPVGIPPDTPSSIISHFALPSVTPTRFSVAYVPYIGMIDTTCLSGYERQSLLNSGYSLQQRTRWLPYNFTFDPLHQNYTSQQPLNLTANASFPESMLIHGCIYAFDNLFIYDLWESYMSDVFTDTVRGDSGNNATPSMLLSGMITRLNGSEALKTIYNYGNVSFDRVNQVFENVSDSMTDFFRLQTLPKYNDPAQGLVTQHQTCLGVRWPWLAFPTPLALLTLAFFIAMLVESRPRASKHASIWKSTPLALLFHGLELLDGRHGYVNDVDGMETMAREIKVRLETTNDGLKLVESACDDQTKGEEGV